VLPPIENGTIAGQHNNFDLLDLHLSATTQYFWITAAEVKYSLVEMLTTSSDIFTLRVNTPAI
jgi:hypothetical protein